MSPNSLRNPLGSLFHDDCTSLQSRADGICLMLGQMCGVVFYLHGQTIGLATEASTPAVLTWLASEMKAKRWVSVGESPLATASHYERVAVTSDDLDSFDESSFFEGRP